MTYEEVLEKYNGRRFGNAVFANPIFGKDKIAHFQEAGITPEILEVHIRQHILDENREVFEILGLEVPEKLQ